MKGSQVIAFYFIVLIAASAWAKTEQRTVRDREDEPTQDEAQSYKQWYDKQLEKDYLQAIDLAIAHARQYPDGRYSEYLRKWLKGTSGKPEKRSFYLDSLALELIGSGANVNMRARDGKTLLMLAAFDGNPEIIKTLVEKGVDVNAQEENHGWTALTYAIWSGEIRPLNVLLAAGADVTMRDKQNATALDHAGATKNSDVVELLERARNMK